MIATSIYLLNILMLFFWGALLLGNLETSRSRALFCSVASLQWFLLSGLRDYSVGSDTISYRESFDNIPQLSWSTLSDRFVGILFQGELGKDPGYDLLQKAFQSISEDYRIFLIAIALAFTVPLGWWIFENSREPLMSFLVYSCLFAAFFAVTGHRQTIATALAVLVGYSFIKSRIFIVFLVLVLIAATLHKSALVVIPFYFLAYKKPTRAWGFTMILVAAVIFVFRKEVMRFVAIGADYEIYAEQFEGAGTETFTVLLLAITALTIWRLPLILDQNPESVPFFNALMAAWLFIPLTYVDPSAMRVVQYYSVYLMLLIPEIILSFRSAERGLVYFVAASSLVLAFARTGQEYTFFWQ